MLVFGILLSLTFPFTRALAAPLCESVFGGVPGPLLRQYSARGVEYSFVRLKDAIPHEDPLLIGFGRPNVFLIVPDGRGGTQRLAAKSLRMGEARVEDSRGLAQAGIFLRIDREQVRPEMLEAIHRSLHEREGTKSWTCVQSVCTALRNAGFTSGGRPLSELFPMPMMERILREGLEWNGEPLRVDLVNASSKSLNEFTGEIRDAQRRTLSRHAWRHLIALEQRFPVTARILRLRDQTRETLAVIFWKREAEGAAEAAAPAYWTSDPSPLGRLMNALGGEHKFIEFPVPRPEVIDLHLPGPLVAYQAKNPSFWTTLKKDFLFSPRMVAFLRNQLHRGRRVEPCPGGCEEMPFIPTSGERYNFVLTNESLILTRLQVRHPGVDWILTKHVLLSGYHPDVRVAGELWRDPQGRVHVNLDSGTYAPPPARRQALIEVLREMFPRVEFVAEVGPSGI